MANGEFLRGEVWWVCLDDSVGCEEKTGRPGIIVSGNGLNEKEGFVTIAYLTTQSFPTPSRPSISTSSWGNGRSRVLCDQLRTVDKSRLTRYMSTCDESEMIRITGALACTLCIPIQQNNRVIETVPKKPEDNENEIVSMRCELDMWKRMYEKTMDQLVEIRVAADVGKRVEAKPTVVGTDLMVDAEVTPEEPKKKTASKKEKSVWDGVKVNVNTVASATELRKRTGMAYNSANEIVRTRKIVGKYEKLTDLLALDYFGEISMKRYGHMLTVGEPESESVPEGKPEKKKQVIVNVNRANTHELMKAGFSKTIAHRIVHHQKNCPPFRSIDELQEIDGITRGDLRKLRDKLEV